MTSYGLLASKMTQLQFLSWLHNCHSAFSFLQIEKLDQSTLAQAMKEILMINPAMKWVLDKAVNHSSRNHTEEADNLTRSTQSASASLSETEKQPERPPMPPYPDMEATGHPSDPPSPGAEAPQWCFCGRCREMPLPEEQVCCQRRRTPGPCVTRTAANAFRFYIIEREVLRLFIFARNDWFAFNDDPTNFDTLRHTAYRLFVLWKHGHLGAGRRVVIPSCVVWKIRGAFPSRDGVYTGFKLSRFN